MPINAALNCQTALDWAFFWSIFCIQIYFSRMCFFSCAASFQKYTHRMNEHFLCVDSRVRHRLQAPSENRLTAAATLAVGLASRQQHLQTVPEHDCSRRPGRDDRKICGKRTQNCILMLWRKCQLWRTFLTIDSRSWKVLSKSPFSILATITCQMALNVLLCVNKTNS